MIVLALQQLLSSLFLLLLMMMMSGSASSLVLTTVVPATVAGKTRYLLLKPSEYLRTSDIIDYDHPRIQQMAQKLRQLSSSVPRQQEGKEGDTKEEETEEANIIRTCFEYVRDEILHSWDYQCKNPVVTCKASEVLIEGTGYCYAKSHLLAALLRANGIPTGLCYQRLTIDDNPKQTPYDECNNYCLHGLNAVYLQNKNKNKSKNKSKKDQESSGDGDDNNGYWYRIDPRGLKAGIQRAEFCPPREVLAFPSQTSLGEVDFPQIHLDPLPVVVETLQKSKTWKDVAENLPDI